MTATKLEMAFLAAAVLLAACSDDGGANGSADTDVSGGGDDGSDSGVLFDATGDSEGDATLPDSDADGGPADGNVAGRHDHTLTVEDETREAIIYVPELAAGDVAAPVVFMFHGTSGDGERFFNISGWVDKADEEGLIAVFPTALHYCFFEDENQDGDYDDPGERKVTTKWNSGVLDDRYPLCTEEDIDALPPDRAALVDHPLRDDVLYVDAILDLLASEYVIDESRVYASGFSNGGSMTSRLAVERSTRFAALASASGFLAVEPAVAERPVPMVLWVGSLDDGFTAALGVDELPLDDSFLTMPGPAALVARYQMVLQLDETYTWESQTVGGEQISRFTFSDSAVGADNRLELAVLAELHHQYPNGDNYGVAAADLLWPFFSEFQLP